MSTNRKQVLTLAVFGMAFLLLTVVLFTSVPTQAAPVAAPTPASVYSGAAGNNNKVTFFNGNLTATTIWCQDLSNYKVIDLQYSVDIGTANGITITTLWGNDNNTALLEANTTAVANATTDSHGGNQYGLYGTYTCVRAQVTNANAIGLRITGLARP